jgi:site-specific DNA-methyltransferase (adenine-specific)
MQIVEKKITELKAYEKNPRKNEKAVAPVAESIKEFGFKVPIIIDSDGVIVAGHTRVCAAKELGMKSVPCIVADDLTPQQIKAFRVADNSSAQIASWDLELLKDELMDLDFDMSIFGLEKEIKDIERIFAPEIIEDDVPEVDEKNIITKLGDIWQLGRHRLMCGDSTILTDVEKLTDGVLVDMLLTDPPYNVNYEGGTKDNLKIKNDNMENDAFYSFLFDAFSAAFLSMKPGAVFYIWHADSEGLNFRKAANDSGLPVKQCLIWNKNALVMGRQDYQWKHEPCLYGWKEGAAHKWNSDRKQTTVIDWNRPSKSAEHPTMKPVGLFDYLIMNNTNKGDIVLDLFAGSGTALIACEQDGRISYSMEFDPKYCDVIIKRWEALTGKKAGLL